METTKLLFEAHFLVKILDLTQQTETGFVLDQLENAVRHQLDHMMDVAKDRMAG